MNYWITHSWHRYIISIIVLLEEVTFPEMAVQRDKGHNTAGKISERWQDHAAAKEQALLATSALDVTKFKCCSLDGDSSQPTLLMLSSDFCNMGFMKLTQRPLLKPLNLMKGIQSDWWEEHREQVGKTGEKKGKAKWLRKEWSERGFWWIRKISCHHYDKNCGTDKMATGTNAHTLWWLQLKYIVLEFQCLC